MSETKTNKRVTIHDVARLSGVSISTVSRVINNYPHVQETKRIKVEQAMKELGFQEGVIAKVLHQDMRQGVGLLLPPTFNESAKQIAEGIIRVAALRKTEVRLFFVSEGEIVSGLSLQSVQRIKKSEITGLIVFDPINFTKENHQVVGDDFPVLFVNKSGDHSFKSHSLLFNYQKSVDEILVKSLSKSSKNVYICDFYSQNDMIGLVRNALKQHANLQNRITNISILDNFDASLGYFSEYLQSHQNGIYIVPNDQVAVSLLRAAALLNLEVPNNIEVVSVLGSSIARAFNPTISNINIDFPNLGAKILDMFNENNSLKETTATIDCYYVKRQSSLD